MAWVCARRYLELGEPLDGFEWSQDPKHPERLDGLDVAAFVVPVDVAHAQRFIIRKVHQSSPARIH